MTTSTIEELTAEEREWLTGNPGRFTDHTATILAKLFRIYDAQVEALKIAKSVRAYAESCSKFHVDPKDDDDYGLMSNPVTRAEAAEMTLCKARNLSQWFRGIPYMSGVGVSREFDAILYDAPLPGSLPQTGPGSHAADVTSLREEQKRNKELTDELTMMKYYGRVTLVSCQQDLKSLQEQVDKVLEYFSNV